MIYLGPDDRHPRALYCGVPGVLVLDFALALYRACLCHPCQRTDRRSIIRHAI